MVVSSTNPATTVQPISFTATLSVVAPGTGTPTGTVSFSDTTTSGFNLVRITGTRQLSSVVRVASDVFLTGTGSISVFGKRIKIGGKLSGSPTTSVNEQGT